MCQFPLTFKSHTATINMEELRPAQLFLFTIYGFPRRICCPETQAPDAFTATGVAAIGKGRPSFHSHTVLYDSVEHQSVR